MNSTKKEKIKNWLIITRIRIVNFIKEHKYVSAVIGLFLVSAVIALAVSAAEEKVVPSAEINTPTLSVETSTKNNVANNFSVVNYEVSYEFGSNNKEEAILDEVITRITLSENYKYAKWQEVPGDEGEASISEDKKTITVTQKNIEISGTKSVSIPLVVLNAAKDSEIKISGFSVQAGSNVEPKGGLNPESHSITTTYDETKITDLSVLAVNGIAQKNNNKTRNAKYGLVLGYDKNIQSLEGYHINDFDNNSKIYLKASDTNNNNLEILNENDSYGIYNEDKHYFNNLPVLSVGKIDSLEDKSSEPTFELLDDDTVHFDKQNSTFNYASKVKINGEVLDCTSDNKCEISGQGSVNLNTAGEYHISYILGHNENTKITQTIIVDSVSSDKKYVLQGPKSLKYFGNNVSASNFTNLYNVKKVTEEEENYPITIEYYKGETKKTTCEYTENNSYTCTGASTFDNNSDYIQKVSIKSAEEGSTKTIEEMTRNITIVSDSTPTPVMNYYELSISDIILSDLANNIYQSANREIYKNGQIISSNPSINTIGSYYITVQTGEITGDYNVLLQASTNKDDLKEADKVVLKTKKNQTGTNYGYNDIYVNESGELVKVDSYDKSGLTGNYYTAAIGEKVEVVSKFHYGLDADSSLDGLEISLNVDDNLTPTSLTEDIEEGSNYYNIGYERYGDELEELESTIEFCPETGDCLPTPADIVVKTIKVKITGEIKNGTDVILRTNYIVKNTENILTDYFNSTAKFTPVRSGGEDESLDPVTTKKVYLTPYKLRTSFEIGEYEDEEFTPGMELNISSNKKYTLTSSIDVSSPIMKQNTNIFGYSTIKVPVVFTLPEGVNYVYNGNYQMQPKIERKSNGTTVLTYTYTGVEPNLWYESIFFDFTIDVATPSGDKTITVVSGDPTTVSKENDLSSSRYKLLNEEFRVVNSEPVAYGQYIYNKNKSQLISSMNENEEFVFETKVYNNKLDDNSTDKSNVKVYTILPYNDEDESSYNGAYSIKFLSTDSDIKCTNEAPSVIKNDLDGVRWEDCSNFKNGDYYSGITAYKTTYNTLPLNTTKITSISVKPNGNAFEDVYKFKSYLKYDGASEVKKFIPAKVEVVSKNISGIVWEDFNENGIMDEEEKRIDSGVILHLYDENNNEVKEPVTPNKNGIYTFSGLEEGNYYVVAEFDYDKYSVANSLADYSDLSKTSVFKTESTEVIKPNKNDEEASSTDSSAETTGDSSDPGDTDDPSDPGDDVDPGDSSGDEDEEDAEDNIVGVVKTDIIKITADTRSIKFQNLGLSLKHHFQPKLNKYITRAEVTNALGIVTKTDFGNTKLAKLNLKNMNNSNIKIVYTLEIENVKYYPGYVKLVTETVPEGMSFNENYSENKGWVLNDDNTITNNSLANVLINEGEKKYLTIAFDLVSKEAGSFVNLASLDDTQILGGVSDDE